MQLFQCREYFHRHSTSYTSFRSARHHRKGGNPSHPITSDSYSTASCIPRALSPQLVGSGWNSAYRRYCLPDIQNAVGVLRMQTTSWIGSGSTKHALQQTSIATRRSGPWWTKWTETLDSVDTRVTHEVKSCPILPMLTICPDPRCSTSSALRTELQEPTPLLQVPNIFKNLQDTKAMMEFLDQIYQEFLRLPMDTYGYHTWHPLDLQNVERHALPVSNKDRLRWPSASTSSSHR